MKTEYFITGPQSNKRCKTTMPVSIKKEISASCEVPAIGIDLGTTYSCVAVWKQNRIEIITNDQGNRITPSRVAFNDTGRLVGDAAKNQATYNPTNTIFG